MVTSTQPNPQPNKPISLTPALQRALVDFAGYVHDYGCAPTEASLGKRMKRSKARASYCIKALIDAGCIERIKGIRYAPWKLTIRGLRLAKKLAKK